MYQTIHKVYVYGNQISMTRISTQWVTKMIEKTL